MGAWYYRRYGHLKNGLGKPSVPPGQGGGGGRGPDRGRGRPGRGGGGGGGSGPGAGAPTDSDIEAIFDGAGDSVWGDPSDLTTLFQLSGGTTAVTSDSDPVGYMGDKSGNNHHWTQATSGDRPLWKTSDGIDFLRFDGSDDQLSNSFGATWSQSNFIAVAFRFLSNTTLADHVYNGISGSARNQLGGLSTDPLGGTMRVFAGNVEQTFGYTAPGQAWRVALVTFDGASTTIRIDGQDFVVSATPGAEGLTGIRLAANAGDSEYANVDIGGLIGFDTPPSAEDQITIEQYLANKVGANVSWTRTTERTSFTEHDGIAYDGTFFYGIDTNALNKYDGSWSLVATNSDPNSDVGEGTSQIDCYVQDGKLWTIRQNMIAAWDTSDLSYLPAEEVPLGASDTFSSVSNGPNSDYIYGVDLNINNNIRVKNRLTGAAVETIPLSIVTTSRQGLTYQPTQGTFLINCDEGVLEFEVDGTFIRNIGFTSGVTPQGMTYDPSSGVAFALNSGSQTIFRFTPTTLL